MKRKLLMAAVALLVAGMQGGCWVTGVQKGTVTKNYDQQGKVTSVVEDTALGDPNTETHRSVRHVATETKENIRVRVEAIKDAVAPKEGDSQDVIPWKAAFGALAIAMIDDDTAQNIKAVPVAKSGYDVADTLVKEGFSFAKGATPWGAVAYLGKKLGDSAGDKTEVNASEGSSVNPTQKKTTQQSTIFASGGDGDNSPAEVQYTPGATMDSPTSHETVNEAAAPATTTATEETTAQTTGTSSE